MTEASDGKRDFFVSFTGADRPWARWVAQELRAGGYTSWFQDEDFAGSIPESMERAHKGSARTLCLLSPAYLASGHCREEWHMRYMEDAGGKGDLLVTLRVVPGAVDGLLGNRAFVDLFDCDEATARRRLLDRLAQTLDPTAKILPREASAFPGGKRHAFPVPDHNLPLFNPDFVGREAILAEIRRALAGGAAAVIKVHAITGLGGVGKTQTALAYCYRHLADHRLIWWLRAAEPATLAADFGSLAAPLGLPEEPDQAKLVQAVKARLQTTRDWLLVLDNAEDPAVVRPYLPGTGGGHVLITSRRTDWHGTATPRALDVMSEPEALQLLTGRPDPEKLPAAELAEAKALAGDLGYLPLALAQARAYMRESVETFAGYRALLGTSAAELLEDGRAHPDYPEPVARTWGISLRAAEHQCPAARLLLELLAFVAPDALPREILDAGPDALPESLRDKLARNRAIGALNRFSLIRAEGGSIAVHRLVQAVTRDGLDEVTAKARAEAVVRLVHAALPDPQEHTNWPAMGALLPHALAATESAGRLEVGLEAAASILNETAVYYNARAAWAEAEPLLQRALAIREKALGPEHPALATRLNNLAELYQDTGRWAEAEPLYQRAIAILEKSLPPDHPNLTKVRENYASLLDALGRSEEAAKFRA
jgi:tetratricopeptide (TPR) repeat protein